MNKETQTAIAELEQVKEFISNNSVDFDKGLHIIVTEYLASHIDYKIKKLSEGLNENIQNK